MDALCIALSGEGLSLRQPLFLPPVLLARNCNILSFSFPNFVEVRGLYWCLQT